MQGAFFWSDSHFSLTHISLVCSYYWCCPWFSFVLLSGAWFQYYGPTLDCFNVCFVYCYLVWLMVLSTLVFHSIQFYRKKRKKKLFLKNSIDCKKTITQSIRGPLTTWLVRIVPSCIFWWSDGRFFLLNLCCSWFLAGSEIVIIYSLFLWLLIVFGLARPLLCLLFSLCSLKKKYTAKKRLKKI